MERIGVQMKQQQKRRALHERHEATAKRRPDMASRPERLQWVQVAEALRGLRLMLAGLGMRHVTNGTPINEALGSDIAATQTARFRRRSTTRTRT